MVNLRELRNKEPKQEQLKDEFADVFIQLLELASSFDINIEKTRFIK